MILMLKFLNGQDMIFDDTDVNNITDIRFLFNSNINNTKISILGDMKFILNSLSTLNELSGECVGVYIDNMRIGGVKNRSKFQIGDTTLVTNISSEPLFENGIIRDASNDKYFLNIDYYTSNVSL